MTHTNPYNETINLYLAVEARCVHARIGFYNVPDRYRYNYTSLFISNPFSPVLNSSKVLRQTSVFLKCDLMQDIAFHT